MITIITNLEKLKVKKMTFKLSVASQERLKGVHPKLLEIIDLALKISKVDFGIPREGGFRTEAQQKVLYDKKLSMCDGTIYISEHQTGRAFDVYAYVDGKASWSGYDLARVATAILQASSQLGYHVEWGGNWERFVDMPHFQLGSEE